MFIIENKDMARERMLVCQSCEKFKPSTHQCVMCSCVMPLKVWFKDSKCPLEKWQSQ